MSGKRGRSRSRGAAVPEGAPKRPVSAAGFVSALGASVAWPTLSTVVAGAPVPAAAPKAAPKASAKASAAAPKAAARLPPDSEGESVSSFDSTNFSEQESQALRLRFERVADALLAPGVELAGLPLRWFRDAVMTLETALALQREGGEPEAEPGPAAKSKAKARAKTCASSSCGKG